MSLRNNSTEAFPVLKLLLLNSGEIFKKLSIMQNDLQMWNFWLGEGRYTITISGIPTGVENMRGAPQNLLGGLSQYNNILKISVKSLKNTCERVHLLKLLIISLQACNFTKNGLLHTHFSRFLARFKLLLIEL